MSKPKHTPGPWKAKLKELRTSYGSLEVRAQSPENPGMYREIAFMEFYKDTREECEANARLIAAAPDMNIALKACVVTLSEIFTAQGLDPNGNQAVQLAFKAIAKAGGSK